MIKLALSSALTAALLLPAAAPAAAGTGGEDFSTATQLNIGSSTETMPVTGEGNAKYFKLPDLAEGEQMTVSAQLLLDPNVEPSSHAPVRFSGQLLKADGTRCGTSGSTNTYRQNIARLPLLSLNTGIKKSDGYSNCYGQGNSEVYLKLMRDGDWQSDTDIDMQLRTTIEPAVDLATLSGTIPERMPPASVETSAQPAAVSGGQGFDTAVELGADSVSTDSVLPYETKYYKVHLAEGQRLNYRLTMGDSPQASADQLETTAYSPLLGTRITDPIQADLDREDVGSSVTLNTITTVSRDLFDIGGERQDLRHPGYYYITVSGIGNELRGQNPQDFELAVQVTGEAAGTDGWEPDSTVQDVQAASALASGTPLVAKLGAALGGAATALAGFGLLWLLRRRKSS